MDAVSPELRSRNMAAIKRKDTKPELVVRQFLHAQGSRRASDRASAPESERRHSLPALERAGEARRLREPQGHRYPLHRRVDIVEPIGRPLFAYLVQHQVEGEPLGHQPPV